MIVKHGNCFLQLSKLRQIVTNMISDWQKKMIDEELAIMNKYAKRGALFSFLYSTEEKNNIRLTIYIGVSVFSTAPLIPFILDLISPLNESRPRLYAYKAYCYFNPDDYYYYVVGYRFEYAVATVENSTKEEIYKMRRASYMKLRAAFQSHNAAMECLMKIEATYTLNLVPQVFITIVVFSVTLFQIAVTEISFDICRLCTFLIAQTVHMLFLTIQGQFVIDSHDTVYEAIWYKMPPKLQLLDVVALRKSLTPPILTAGGLMRLDLNSFAQLLKACVSYYTALRPSYSVEKF
ncbi:PREDICTED: uncharacterized protein LOC108575990 [Habropoda laboriosa]|uniref:uncharacterized protein LOC108575990 n=1 Tax=Habropoda laboriosa TaxID=597456 RepID=UPI00083E07F6|nr:PREDICTED: uncharacterized protein LOC108575990 [Habropoda laboriosa]